MKQLGFIFLLLSSISAYSQESQIKDILANVKRDSTDKTCKLLFDDFYDSFDSDAGMMNPKIMTATINIFKYKSDSQLPNGQLAVLLFQYDNAVSDPEKALKWISALKQEYKNVYGRSHPLILLYEGESLSEANRKEEAHAHFMEFLKEYPQSVIALVNAYGGEKDENLKKMWLDKLKSEHPNHWAVKKLK